ncbi:MAG: DUF1285 domain-containing protein [Xanthomonadaceae bacterium]|nr:DUF1285 domain-containing protein [Xanthomonadaceae bacterium]
MRIKTDVVTIDRAGKWWYQGNQIIHSEILALFKQSLEKDPETGDLFIYYRGEKLSVEVESCPFFIRNVRVVRDGQGEPEAITLVLDDGSDEALVPDSLILDSDGVLKAVVKKGKFMGCCLPAAQFRLAELFDELADGSFQLRLNKKSYLIHCQHQ